jgi:RNase H-fold protein (predicted Holliday junction resolvase)
MKTKYCTNTVNVKKMRDYLVKCEPINEILKSHYEEKIYRKLGWNVYMNMERSEAKMINNFSEKIGNKDTTTVIVGDYSVHSTNMRGTIPAISKKIIKIFKRYGYEVYLINEYNTSKLCNECCSKTENFHKGLFDFNMHTFFKTKSTINKTKVFILC